MTKASSMKRPAFTMIVCTGFAAAVVMGREAPPLQRPTTAQLHAAMNKLDWMIGQWEGSGWIESATAGRRQMSYSVNVRPEAGGLLLIIDGVGIGSGAEGWKIASDSSVAYAEQVLISGPAPDLRRRPPGTAYTWQEFSRGTLMRGNDAQGIERGVWVGLPFIGDADCDLIGDESYRKFCRDGGEPLWSRTTIVLNDNDEWVQTREWQDNEAGRRWHLVFQVVLRRVKQVAK